MNGELDYTFHAMGSDVRFLIGSPLLPTAAPPLRAADREKAYVLDFGRRLSRFAPESELTRLNHDRRTTVPASPLLRVAVSAGLWAAQRSGGLIDPTLVGALQRVGYDRSLDGARPESLHSALAQAPPRRPARPDPDARWAQIAVDDDAGTISRPPGVMFDSGGIGKGLCADAVAHRLRTYTRFVVDCGGDIAVGGVGAQLDPYEIEIEHPLTGRPIGRIEVGRGGVATSGINVRIWRDVNGRIAHHLIDPGTGRPAWTGVIGATALAPTALEAETLSKLALLLGPAGARTVLADHGGLIVRDDGDVETIGPLRSHIESPAEVPA